MITIEELRKLGIDLGAVGLEQSDTSVTYFCTPRDAEIIGWAGVDGIHYCTIPEFGEMIFAVSPMNFGDYVHLIARNLEDLLRMLLFCVDMAALEQCFAWDEEQFKAFMIDCPATDKQRAVLDAIRDQFHIEPMEDTFAYVKALQAEFDLSKIPYTEEYYDLDMNAAAPALPVEWRVTKTAVAMRAMNWTISAVLSHATKPHSEIFLRNLSLKNGISMIETMHRLSLS